MPKDILFLLPPGFKANGRREYCPECAEAWGLLHYFPAIKESLDIEYQNLQKPRPQLVALLGEDNQNCPTLVLDDNSPRYAECDIQEINGIRFIANARGIGRYYSQRFGLPVPR